jgi:hypothetical protein
MKTFALRALGAVMLTMLLAGSVPAQQTLDPMLRLLVKKGVITLDEAMGIQKEASETKAADQKMVADTVTKGMDTSTKYALGKGVTFTKGDMNLNINGRVQTRYDAGDEDADKLGKVFGGAREGKDDTFDVRRARVTFQGSLTKQVSYKFQYDIASSGALKDAELTWRNQDGTFAISGGQFKVPFGREQLNSSGDLQLVDRSIVDAFFHPERDRGVLLSGQSTNKGKLHYAVGAFNTEGENKRNDDGDFRTVARIGFDPFGHYKPVQSDFERSKDPRLAFALAYLHDDLAGTTGSRDSWGFDFGWAYKGVSIDGEWVTTDHDLEGASDYDADGWRLQAGFMLYKDVIELVARAASIDAGFPGDETFIGEGPDYLTGRGFKTLGKTTDDGSGGVDGAIYDDITAYTLGLSFYFHGHANKLQLDYTWVDEEGFGADAVDLDNDFFRAQYQIKF